MLKLGGRFLAIQRGQGHTKKILRLSEDAELPPALRPYRAYVVRDSRPIPEGFSGYILLSEPHREATFSENATVVRLSEDYSYLRGDDIVRLNFVDQSLRVLFRSQARCNFFLVTEQCNSYCLMCSQPPKQIDDGWVLDELREVIPLIPEETMEIGFSGGEPFLHGQKFLDVLRLAKNMLPRTAVHVLSNGRAFANPEFAQRYAALRHPDLMVGIPIYSDDASTHDYVVQARGAFDETVCGILNLKALKQRVEIRVVLHRQTVGRLPQLAEFISRNLLFVDQVALMGLEITGFTRANLEELWIEPKEYGKELCQAVRVLEAYRIPVSIYNHQLCTIDRSLWRFCSKSISEWKTEYLDVCIDCSVISECGGFFSSSIQFKHSAHITPIK